MNTTISNRLAAILLGCVLLVPVTLSAQDRHKPDVPPAPVIGDGAAECADGKIALLTRMTDQPARSLASSNIDITYYHLDLNIDLVGHIIYGIVRIEGVVVTAPMSSLVLDLASTMTVSAVALSDGTPLTFNHVGYALEITMPSTVLVGGDVKVDITYDGIPSTGGFGYFVFGERSGNRYAWSLSEPYGAREWWPCKDHPGDKADAVRVTVTVLSQYKVGSQGTLVSETINGGETTFDWVSNYPISSYLISVAVGVYVSYSGVYVRPPALESLYGPLTMPIEHLVYDDGSSALFPEWPLAGDMIEVFEECFGPYPFANEKYGHAECTFGGGMEHQTMSSMGGSSVGLVAHELAHMWYGDNISPETWPHLWLNEGFATYGELVYYEARPTQYPGLFESRRLSRYNSAKSASGTLVLADTSSVSTMFAASRVYHKGATVLFMLRTVVGDTVFKDILRAYTSDPAVQLGVAQTSDFLRVAETVSGMELDTFFSQWITDGTGYPHYRMSANWYPKPGGYDVYVAIDQTQTTFLSNVHVFEMPVTLAIQTTAGEERFVVQNNQRSQLYQLSVAAEPTLVTLDPDKYILRNDFVASGIGDTPPVSGLSIRSLTPNPVNGVLSIQYELGLAGELAIDVFDVAGRRVLSRSLQSLAGPQLTQVETSSLPAGVYFVRVNALGRQTTRKFVVVR